MTISLEIDTPNTNIAPGAILAVLRGVIGAFEEQRSECDAVHGVKGETTYLFETRHDESVVMKVRV
jgi:hypothetical protein